MQNTLIMIKETLAGLMEAIDNELGNVNSTTPNVQHIVSGLFTGDYEFHTEEAIRKALNANNFVVVGSLADFLRGMGMSVETRRRRRDGAVLLKVWGYDQAPTGGYPVAQQVRPDAAVIRVGDALDAALANGGYEWRSYKALRKAALAADEAFTSQNIRNPDDMLSFLNANVGRIETRYGQNDVLFTLVGSAIRD